MTAADWIAEQRRIEQAATEGGWRAAVVARYVDDDGCERGKGGIYPAGPMGPPPLFVTPDWVAADAEFIADSRTALPKALDALEAVLAMHKQGTIKVLTGDCSIENCEHEDECPEVDFDICLGCYEQAERIYTYYGEQGVSEVEWPCPPVLAITEALGVEP